MDELNLQRGMVVVAPTLEQLRNNINNLNVARHAIPFVKSFGVIVGEERQDTGEILSDELKVVEGSGNIVIKPGYAIVKGVVHFYFPTNTPAVDTEYESTKCIPVIENVTVSFPSQDVEYNLILKPKKNYTEPHAKTCNNCYNGEDKLRYADSYETEMRLATGAAPDIGLGEVWLATAKLSSGSGVITVVDKRQENIFRWKDTLIPRYRPDVPIQAVIYKIESNFIKTLHPNATPEEKAKLGDDCYIQLQIGYEGQGTRDGSNTKKLNITTTIDPAYGIDMWYNHKLYIKQGSNWVPFTIAGNDASSVTCTEDLPVGGPHDIIISPGAEIYEYLIIPKDSTGSREYNKAVSFRQIKNGDDNVPTPILYLAKPFEPNVKHDIFVRGISRDGYLGPFSADYAGTPSHPSIDVATPTLEVAAEVAMTEDKAYPAAPKLINSIASFELSLAGGYSSDEEGLAPKTCYIQWEWGEKLDATRNSGNAKRVDCVNVGQSWIANCWVGQYLSYHDIAAGVWKKTKVTANDATSSGTASIYVEEDIPVGTVDYVVGPGAWGYKLVQWLEDESNKVIEESQQEIFITKDSRDNTDSPTPPRTFVQGLLPGKTYKAKVKSLSPAGEYETDFSVARTQITPSIAIAAPPQPKIIGVEEKCSRDFLSTGMVREYTYQGEGAATKPVFATGQTNLMSHAGSIAQGVSHAIWWGDKGQGDKDATNPYKLNVTSSKWGGWTDDWWIGQKLVIGLNVFDVIDSGSNWVEVNHSGNELPAGTGHHYVLGPNAEAYELEEEVLDASDDILPELHSGIALFRKFSPVPPYKTLHSRVPHVKYKYKVRSVHANGVTKSDYSAWYEQVAGVSIARVEWDSSQALTLEMQEPGSAQVSIPEPSSNSNIVDSYELIYEDDGVTEGETSTPDFSKDSRQVIAPAAKRRMIVPTKPSRFVKVKVAAIDCLGRRSFSHLTSERASLGAMALKAQKVWGPIQFDLTGTTEADRFIALVGCIRQIYTVIAVDVTLTKMTGDTQAGIRVFPDGRPGFAEYLDFVDTDIGKNKVFEIDLTMSELLTLRIDGYDTSHTPDLAGFLSITYIEPEIQK